MVQMQRQPSTPPPSVQPLHDHVQVVATHNEPVDGPIPIDLATDPDSELAARFRFLRHR